MRGLLINGQVVFKWRKENGLTQAELARKAFCDIKTIRCAELGKPLDASTVKRIGQPLTSLVIVLSASVPIALHNAQLVRQWQVASNVRDVDALIEFYHGDAVI